MNINKFVKWFANCFRRIIFLFYFILYLTLTSADLMAISGEDGFLGIDILSYWQGGTSTIDENIVANNRVGLQLSLIGVSGYYEIITQFILTTNLIHASKQYSGSSDYLDGGEVDYFSYSSLNIQYSVWRNKYFNVLVGYGLGHLGYLSDSFTVNPYSLFISPVGSFWWFISKYFATSIKANFPIGLYSRNANRLWHLQFKHEVIFEPNGTIVNPMPTSIFLTLGWGFDYIDIITKANSRNTTVMIFQPYFRFTYLY